MKKYFLLWSGLVVMLAFFIRLFRLDGESLFMDEIRQVSYYRQSPLDIIHLAASQNQPPLDYWIGWLVARFDYSDFAVRLPALLFGTLSVALIIVIVRRLSTPFIAIVTGMVLALLPYAIYFSQEARPYSIAIFFCLAFVLQVLSLLQSPRSRWWEYLLLFLITLCFLHTRALAPLLLVTSSCGILFAQGVLLALRDHKNSDNLLLRIWKQRVVRVVGICVLAMVCYLPNFLLLLAMGRTYVHDSKVFSMGVLWHGIERFMPQRLWEALLVQGEPFGVLLALGCFAALIVSFRLSLRKNSTILFIVWLLPVTSLAHLFIFQAKTVNFFRPPYAVYVLPLSLIITAWITFIAWQKLALSTRNKKLIAQGACFLIALQLVVSLLDYYATPKHTNWRDMASYLRTTSTPDQLVVLDSFTPLKRWKPDGYGFARYSFGETRFIPLERLAEIEGLDKLTLKPVLMLFHRHAYFMTARSIYPFITHGEIQYTQHVPIALRQNPEVAVKSFTGLSLVQRRRSSGNFSRDLYFLLNQLVPYLEKDESIVDVYLACYFLAQRLEPDRSKSYLETIIPLIRPDQQAIFQSRLQAIHEALSRDDSQH